MKATLSTTLASGPTRRAVLAGGVAAALGAPALRAWGQKRYDPGASDTEIKIGQTMPYSGPASAYGTIGRTEAAYFRKINDAGGINGRRINFISLDDAYSPPKTVEMTRRLVEQDEVLLLFGMLGTPTNSAIQKYVNARKIPHLCLATGASKFCDPEHFPWTMSSLPTYSLEAKVWAKHIRATMPDARIAVLMQNDDFGRDYFEGLKEGLGDQASRIVSTATYEATDPNVDSQIISLRTSDANVLIYVALPRTAAQAIRKTFDIGWRPTQYITNVSANIPTVYAAAGIEKSIGITAASYIKDPKSPEWADDPGMKDYVAFMKKYHPEGEPSDTYNVAGCTYAQTLVQILRQCNDDLSRQNVMRQAANLIAFQLPLVLPGITCSTSPTDYRLYKALQLRRFDGNRFVNVGSLVQITA